MKQMICPECLHTEVLELRDGFCECRACRYADDKGAFTIDRRLVERRKTVRVYNDRRKK
jgi:ribosomal protein L37AE/L43A